MNSSNFGKRSVIGSREHGHQPLCSKNYEQFDKFNDCQLLNSCTPCKLRDVL